MSSALNEALHELLGERCLLPAESRASYERDWTGRYVGRACAVVLPISADEVAQVLLLAAEHGVPVVPQGGNTGLVGGAVPQDGAVLLSTARLESVHVDARRRQVVAGAGATLAAVHRAAAAFGLLLPVDLGSREQATVGGVVATNAGGLRAHRYGRAGQWLRGAVVVTADGVVVDRLTPPEKESAGFEVYPLLCGSEGTLGVLTAVRMQLVDRPHHRTAVLLSGNELLDLTGCVSRLEQLHGPADAVEGWFADGLAACLAQGLERYPLDAAAACHLLAEWSGADDRTDRLLDDLDASAGEGVAVAVGLDDEDRRRLWAAREMHPLLVTGERRPVLKVDTAVASPERVPALREQVTAAALATDPAARVVLFGHVMEGNLHVNVATDDPEAVLAAVCEAALGLGGTVSAEHGIGRLKRPWVARMRSAEDLGVLQRLKSALDPGGVLNPGVLLP